MGRRRELDSVGVDGRASERTAKPVADGKTLWHGSAESFSSDHWAVNDYYQFQLSTSSFFDIFVSFDQTSSGTGPRNFKLQYDYGSGFTDFANHTVLENGASPNASWNSTTAISAYSYSFDLSAIGAIENVASVTFRLVDLTTTSASGGTVGTGGSDRVDNFTVSGTKIASVPTVALVQSYWAFRDSAF